MQGVSDHEKGKLFETLDSYCRGSSDGARSLWLVVGLLELRDIGCDFRLERDIG